MSPVIEEYELWAKLEQDFSPEFKLMFSDWLLENTKQPKRDEKIARALRWCGRRKKHPDFDGRLIFWYDKKAAKEDPIEEKSILPSLLIRLLNEEEGIPEMVDHFLERSTQRIFLKLGHVLTNLQKVVKGAE